MVTINLTKLQPDFYNSAQFHETFTDVNSYGRRYIYCPRAISRVHIRAVSLQPFIDITKAVARALTFHKSCILLLLQPYGCRLTAVNTAVKVS